MKIGKNKTLITYNSSIKKEMKDVIALSSQIHTVVSMIFAWANGSGWNNYKENKE